MTTPNIPYGAPAVSTPHFRYPFTMTNAGAEVVQQDTLEEVFACVQAIAYCSIGEFPEVPNFGIPDLTGNQMPLNPEVLISAINLWEPRAEESAVALILDDLTEQITLSTSTVGTTGA